MLIPQENSARKARDSLRESFSNEYSDKEVLDETIHQLVTNCPGQRACLELKTRPVLDTVDSREPSHR